jgi:5-methylcytosine-specific restriction endonuclease McrA
LGGKDELDNLWALCPDCHVRKGDAAKIAKARRVSKRRADFEARMAEKAGR